MKKFKYYQDVRSIVLLTAATLLQVFTLQAILTPANLLPSGFLGISVLIQNISKMFLPTPIPLNISSLVLNVVVAFLCYKGLSKRFAFLSLFQVVLSSFFLSIFHFQPILHDVMLAVLLGGALNGIYIALALYADGSTGGTDFIALYVSNKKGKSIWEYVFVGNVILLIVFALTSSWEQAGFSILFQFVATKTLENFHHRYEQLTLQITTETPEKIMDYYFENYKHGMSCIEGVGGYTHRKIYILYTVISSYELKEITKGILNSDPKAIINVMSTEQFYGNFYREKH
ncbi:MULTISPECIES: YitT family protein [unclassified Granulicatella]|uniref:YitT family protein n=1 Tax=unclassified Granulicatella TaxID=2630493 RepID=UPI001967D365|nr:MULTISPECIES: YitT family protein [unclassified Granulicatella]MBS4750148.1 YitT family protein [Carnobacteriaceae bacterium zg-ZUI78]